MGIEEKILTYLSAFGKAHKYKIAKALKTDVSKITKALSKLREEGKIEVKSGNVMLVKGKKPIKAKARKRKKQPRVAVKEKKTEEEPIEGPKEEKEPEKIEEEKEVEASKEEIEEEQREEGKEERMEGTVKFFNPNKGFGFITGDDGKEYYVHKSGLKEGIIIKADERVSFKVVQETQGPKAEEVEKVSQRTEELERTDL